jgi:hypothetical protein
MHYQLYRTRKPVLFLLLILTVALILTLVNAQPVHAATFNEGCTGSVGDAASLQADVATSNSNNVDDVINLTGGCTYTLTANLDTQSDGGRSLTINGNGATIDGAGAFIIITVRTNLTLNNVTLQNGRASGFQGGAIYQASLSTITINNSTLRNNYADSFGGAIQNNNGTLIINNSTFSGNSTGTVGVIFGGAIYNQSGTVTITNSTFTGNTAAYAGAIFSNGGAVTINSSTIAGNSANGAPGGVLRNAGAMTLQNTIVAGNTCCGGSFASDMTGSFTSLGYNLIGAVNPGAYSPGPSGAGSTDITNVSANLGSLANNGGPTQTMALNAGSPAIGAVLTGCQAADQRGILRPAANCDIGAFQLTAYVPPVPTDEASAPASVYPAMCLLLGHPENPAIRAVVPANIATISEIPVNVCYSVLTNPVQIGVTDRPITLAVEVVAYTTTDSKSVAALNQSIEICLQGAGSLLYRDATGQPRVVTTLNATNQGGFTCGSIPNAGTVILVP